MPNYSWRNTNVHRIDRRKEAIRTALFGNPNANKTKDAYNYLSVQPEGELAQDWEQAYNPLTREWTTGYIWKDLVSGGEFATMVESGLLGDFVDTTGVSNIPRLQHLYRNAGNGPDEHLRGQRPNETYNNLVSGNYFTNLRNNYDNRNSLPESFWGNTTGRDRNFDFSRSKSDLQTQTPQLLKDAESTVNPAGDYVYQADNAFDREVFENTEGGTTQAGEGGTGFDSTAALEAFFNAIPTTETLNQAQGDSQSQFIENAYGGAAGGGFGQFLRENSVDGVFDGGQGLLDNELLEQVNQSAGAGLQDVPSQAGVTRTTGSTFEGGPFNQQTANDLLRGLLESGVNPGTAIESLSAIQDLLLTPGHDQVREEYLEDREDQQLHQTAIQNLINTGQANVANTQSGRYGRTGDVTELGQFRPQGSPQESDLNRFNQELLANIQAGLTPFREGTEAQADRNLASQLGAYGVNNPYGFANSLERTNADLYNQQLGSYADVLALEASQGATADGGLAQQLTNQRLATDATGGLLGFNDPNANSQTLRDLVLNQIVAQASGGLINQNEIARQQTLANTNNPFSFVQNFITPSQGNLNQGLSTQGGPTAPQQAPQDLSGVPQRFIPTTTAPGGSSAYSRPPYQEQQFGDPFAPTPPTNYQPVPFPVPQGGYSPPYGGPATVTPQGQGTGAGFAGQGGGNWLDNDPRVAPNAVPVDGPSPVPNAQPTGIPSAFDRFRNFLYPDLDQLRPSGRLEPDVGPTGNPSLQPQGVAGATTQDQNLARALQALRDTQLAAAAPDLRQQNINLLSNPSALGAFASIAGPSAVSGLLSGINPGGGQQPVPQGGATSGEISLAANSDEDVLLQELINNPNIVFDGSGIHPIAGPFDSFGLGNFNNLSPQNQEFGLGVAAAGGQGPQDLFSALSANTPGGKQGAYRSTFSSQLPDYTRGT